MSDLCLLTKEAPVRNVNKHRAPSLTPTLGWMKAWTPPFFAAVAIVPCTHGRARAEPPS